MDYNLNSIGLNKKYLLKAIQNLPDDATGISVSVCSGTGYFENDKCYGYSWVGADIDFNSNNKHEKQTYGVLLRRYENFKSEDIKPKFVKMDYQGFCEVE